MVDLQLRTIALAAVMVCARSTGSTCELSAEVNVDANTRELRIKGATAVSRKLSSWLDISAAMTVSVCANNGCGACDLSMLLIPMGANAGGAFKAGIFRLI